MTEQKRMTNKEGLDFMIECLETVEKVHIVFDDAFWGAMCQYLGEVAGTITWQELSALKDALVEFKEVFKDRDFTIPPMTHEDFTRAFYAVNPLGRVWVNEDDNICIKATSTAKTEVHKGTYDYVADKLGIRPTK